MSGMSQPKRKNWGLEIDWYKLYNLCDLIWDNDSFGVWKTQRSLYFFYWFIIIGLSICTPVLQVLRWLPVEHRIIFKLLCTTYRCMTETSSPLQRLLLPYKPVRQLINSNWYLFPYFMKTKVQWFQLACRSTFHLPLKGIEVSQLQPLSVERLASHP